jgi:hypothetical protein
MAPNAALGVLAGAQAAGQAVGGIAGAISAKKARDQQQAFVNKAIAEIEKLELPDIEKMRLVAENFTPEMLAGTAYEDIVENPAYQQAQMQALEGMAKFAKGGLTDTDQMAMRQVALQTAMDERGAREAMRQNLAQRGMGGSGFEQAQGLLGSQSAAMRQNAAGTQMASDAQNRALQALAQQGSMAGQMRGQDFDVASRRASAADEVRRLNMANVNQGRLQNLMNRQDIARYNAGLLQQQYNNAAQKAGMMSSAYTGGANYAGSNADSSRGLAGELFQGAGTTLGRLADIDWTKAKDGSLASGASMAGLGI